MWFNRKSTAFQHAFAQFERRLNALETRIKEEKSENDRNLLEFAELAEKMRRTYLRLSRIVKVDSQQTSEPEPDAQNVQNEVSPRETRDHISRSMFENM